MRRAELLIAFVAVLNTVVANAACEVQTDVRYQFDYYEPYLDAFRVRVNSYEDDLKLSHVSVRAVDAIGKEQTFLVEVPLWIRPLQGQPFKVPEHFQILELETRYSGDCQEIVYRQQFQDELVSLSLDEFIISWAGKGFGIHLACFTEPEDYTIDIR